MSNGKWKIFSPAMLCDEASPDLTHLTVRSATNDRCQPPVPSLVSFLQIQITWHRGRIKPQTRSLTFPRVHSGKFMWNKTFPALSALEVKRTRPFSIG
jgi:hypothetical protein